MDACITDSSPTGARDTAMFALLNSSGLWRAEIVALDIEDYDVGEGTLTVKGKRNKELSKAIIQRYTAELREKGGGPSSLNQRLTAIRKPAQEASDNGALSEAIANSIRTIKGVHQEGRRSGNWLTREQAQALLNSLGAGTLKGLRDRAILAVLIGCGPRRQEVADLTFEHIQQREGDGLSLT